jgi:hypothetical protein
MVTVTSSAAAPLSMTETGGLRGLWWGDGDLARPRCEVGAVLDENGVGLGGFGAFEGEDELEEFPSLWL